MAPTLTQTSSIPRRASGWAGWLPAVERFGWLVASFATFALLWQAAAMLAADPRLFPGPIAVFARMGELASSGALVSNILVTLERLIYAFTAAMVIGSVIDQIGRASCRERV